MRKSFVLLLTGLLAVLILSACGQKSQEDIVNGLDKKAKEYTSYK
ncbi:outer membrane lipoprotein carrier protein LolA, partial [Bacillus amyloliquefaciens]|nr:outer membrane lipoprotein carrier protein LolA [Bacillus amyloliquefaciens]